MRAVRVTPEDDVSVVEVEDDFRSLAAAIGCEYIEIVRPRYAVPGLDPGAFIIVCDEIARLRDPRPALNGAASIGYGTQFHGNPILGTVLVMRPSVDPFGESDFTDMSEGDAEAVAEAIRQAL